MAVKKRREENVLNVYHKYKNKTLGDTNSCNGWDIEIFKYKLLNFTEA